MLAALLDHLDKIASIAAALFAAITYRESKRRDAGTQSAPSNGQGRPWHRWTPRQLRRTAVVSVFIFIIASTFIIVRLLHSDEGGPHPTPSLIGVPSLNNTSPAREFPRFHYHEKASATGEDIDINLRHKGEVLQRFTAASDKIGSVAVIVSRVVQSGESVGENEVGLIRLSLHALTADDNVANAQPIRLLGSEGSLSEDGVLINASPSHGDTVIQLDDVPIEPGKRYAFKITMEEPGAVMAISLRPVASRGNTMDARGLTDGTDFIKRKNRAVSGYVCRQAAGC